MKTLPFLLATALIALISGTARGQTEPTLKIGDPAPKLQVSKWAQGEPVDGFKNGTAYIVEFWATWCGPCRTSIPHLNELHTKFKDKGLVVIGQDCWERDESLVPKFLKEMGSKMTYRVALDDKSQIERGVMAVNWMQAAGRTGIPAAFVLNKEGRIAWIGHPMSLKEEVIEQILAGTFDIKKAAADYLAGQKTTTATSAASRKYSEAYRKKDWAGAMSALTEMEKLLPEDQRNRYAALRVRLLLLQQDHAAASQFARQVGNQNPKDALLQNSMAWTLVSFEGVEKRDLALAETLATRANNAAEGKNPNILDTLARVHFLKGEKEKAIALQQKVVELADEKYKARFQATLDSYKAGKVPGAE